jgi:serine/threonine protein kinase
VLGTLLGNYRVVEQLGQGGMGVVYVGRHEQLGHRVVVKVLRPEMSRNAVIVKRFFNEAQAATAIRNPGIAQVFDFGQTEDGRAYFVMELLEGVTLSQRLSERPLEIVECCRLARQMANVLQSAHGIGITHRDLKPDNLFLVPDAEVAGGERVKVLDFGIAKLAGELQAARARRATCPPSSAAAPARSIIGRISTRSVVCCSRWCAAARRSSASAPETSSARSCTCSPRRYRTGRRTRRPRSPRWSPGCSRSSPTLARRR